MSQGDGCLSCSYGIEPGVLLPHLAGAVAERTELAAAWLCIRVRARAKQAACPACRCSSDRVHSRCGRRLADAAIGGRRVLIRLAVRRFFCGNRSCTCAETAPQPGQASDVVRGPRRDPYPVA